MMKESVAVFARSYFGVWALVVAGFVGFGFSDVCAQGSADRFVHLAGTPSDPAVTEAAVGSGQNTTLLQTISTALAVHDTNVCNKVTALSNQVDSCCDDLANRIDGISISAMGGDIDSCCDALSTAIADARDDVMDSVDSCCDVLSNRSDSCCADLASRIDSISISAMGGNFDSCCDVLSTAIADARDDVMNSVESCCDALSNQNDSCCADLASRIDSISVSAMGGNFDSCCEEITSRLDGPVCSKLDHIIEHVGTCFGISQADLGVFTVPNVTLIGTTTAAYVITQPGVYCLLEDLTIDTGAVRGIRIQADNVELDLRGYTLTTDGASSFIGIEAITSTAGVKRERVTIKNGKMFGPNSDMIVMWGGAGFTIEDLILEGTTGIHIRPDGADTSNPSVAGVVSRVICTGGFIGIRIRNSLGIEVRDTVCSNNSSNGILVVSESAQNCEACIFRRVTTIGNGFSGIAISSSFQSRAHVCEECVSNRNGRKGFVTSNGCVNTTFVRCIACENSEEGFLIDGTQTTIRECIATDNTLEGFKVVGSDNSFIACTATSNGTKGFDNSANTSTDNFFAANVARQNGAVLADNYDNVNEPVSTPATATNAWENMST